MQSIGILVHSDMNFQYPSEFLKENCKKLLSTSISQRMLFYPTERHFKWSLVSQHPGANTEYCNLHTSQCSFMSKNWSNSEKKHEYNLYLKLGSISWYIFIFLLFILSIFVHLFTKGLRVLVNNLSTLRIRICLNICLFEEKVQNFLNHRGFYEIFDRIC
jgi:hypothetical protein